MWQRFTEPARKAIFYAQEESQRLGQGYVSTEHLLLGLLREPDNAAVRILSLMGVNIAGLREAIQSQLDHGDARPHEDMTLTPRGKRVIDLAYDEARDLNDTHIGTEHLLLGLIRDGDGLAARILDSAGVRLEVAREALLRLCEESGDPPVRPATGDPSIPDRVIRSARSPAATLFLMLQARPPRPVARMLELGTNLPAVIRTIEATLRTMPSDGPEEESLEELLALAQEEAKARGSENIRSEHLLLAILAARRSFVPHLLALYDLNLEGARAVLDGEDG
jgi:ATP-dependent Clp protease ATP-binding subunit ClpA